MPNYTLALITHALAETSDKEEAAINWLFENAESAVKKKPELASTKAPIFE